MSYTSQYFKHYTELEMSECPPMSLKITANHYSVLLIGSNHVSTLHYFRDNGDDDDE